MIEIIAEAWEAEEDRHKMYLGVGREWILSDKNGNRLFVGPLPDCEAHLSRLCAAAVLRALQEKGLAVVPVEPTEDQMRLCYDWAISAGVDANQRFYRAMIALAAPPLLPIGDE